MKNKKLFWIFMLQLIVCAHIAMAQYHPDKVYPIPNNYGKINESGVNLFTGDLNLEFPLASISGKNLSYSLSVSYNSRSMAISTPADNALGGKGWKLMDYPKIVKEGNKYFYLDGQKAQMLMAANGGSQYLVDGSDYLLKFTKTGISWSITTESGIQYQLTNKYTENGYTFWSIGKIEDPNWGDKIDFSYTLGQLNSINNSLGDKIQLIYNGKHLSRIDIYHDQSINDKDAVLRDKTSLNYNDHGIRSIESHHKIHTSLFSKTTPALEFEYNTKGRIHKIISPSGAIQSYKYYTGAKHPELLGAVIRYSTDNGYPNITDKVDGVAYNADKDAIYSAIWYKLANSKAGSENIFRQYNTVRVYPGGFRTNDPENYNNSDANLKDPFGHQTYYFFNGNGTSTLDNLPTDYNGSTIVNNPYLIGYLYQAGQYSDQSISESTSNKISLDQNIYKIQNYRQGTASIEFPLLDKNITSRDGVDALTTQYEYYEQDDYYLPKSIINSRLNPKKNDPDYKEYEKVSNRYAFQDYPFLRNNHILHPLSRSYTEVAAYSNIVASTDNSLSWKVTNAQLTLWKDWTNTKGGWSSYRNYILKKELTTNRFPVNLSSPIDPSYWLQTDEVLKRNTNGLTTVIKDVDQLKSSIIFDDKNNIHPVASFSNSDVTNYEASYYGFEEYESNRNWVLSEGVFNKEDAHTGEHSYLSTGTVSVRSQNYNPKEEVSYLFGAFIKNKGNGVGVLGFKAGEGWAAMKNIPVNALEWQYISVVISASLHNIPTIECENCLIDDIRFHPVDASFSATVYKDTKVEDDDLTVNKSGTYKANYAINVAPNFTLSPGKNLQLSAGEKISFGVNTSIKVGATASIKIGDYATDMDEPIASLGANGETYRQVYNSFNTPIATVGPNDELRNLNISYNSREGIDIFSDSDPNDLHFDMNYPNMGLELTARKKGSWEGFEFKDHHIFNALHQMSIVDGRLITDNYTSGNAFAALDNYIDSPDYAIYTDVYPNNMADNSPMGIRVYYSKGYIELGINRNQISLNVGDSDVKSKTIKNLPDHLNLLLVVMDGKHLFAYANGRFLFDHIMTENLLGSAIHLYSYNPGGAFDNFMVLEDPTVGKNTYDALGQHKQSLFKHEPDELFVTETMYGDYLNLPMAATRGTHINTAGTNKGLSYRNDFAELSINSNGSPSVTGKVKDAHGFDTPFTVSRTYDDDPSLRADRSGSAGAFTAGKTHSIDNSYGANHQNNAFGFYKDKLGETTQQSPYTENENSIEKTYSGANTGAVFGSMHKDLVTDKTIQQQLTYDENMQVKKHYQPNYFSDKANGREGYYSETAYNFFGNITFNRNPDYGIVQNAYGSTQRFRARLDANGVEAATPYLLYWKYDVLGRIIENGIYEDTNINKLVSTGTTNTVTVPGKITVKEGTYSNLILRAGVSISFEVGTKIPIGSTVSAILVKDALQEHLGANLNNSEWPQTSDIKRKVKTSYTYDSDPNPTNKDNKSLGRLVVITNNDNVGQSQQTVTQNYVYDLQGNIIEVKRQIDQENPVSVNYNYNLLGDIKTISNSGYNVSYGYDRLGRVKNIGNDSDPDFFAAYQYDNDTFTETLGNGVVGTFTYNNEGLTGVIQYKFGSKTLFRESLYYTHRKNGESGYYNGNIASADYNIDGSDDYNYEYTYDAFDRLKEAKGTYTSGVHLPDKSINYDVNGNIELVNSTQNPGAYNYVSGTNRIANIDTDKFKYDSSGNVTGYEKFNISNITYDPVSNLSTHIVKNEQTTKFRYNGNNQRVRKQNGVNKVTYLHGLNSYPILELTEKNERRTFQAYIYGPTGNIAIVQDDGANNVYYPLKDHLGSTRVLTNSEGGNVGYFNYSPFGETLNSTISPPIKLRYRYTGQEYDAETNLYNYRARLYDPAIGRFYAPDPSGQQNSSYAYVGNNPISLTDPTGEWFGLDDLFATAIGAFVGVTVELVSEAVSGDGISFSKLGVAAVAGAAAGETTLYAGPIAGGAVGGALNKFGDNLVDGNDALDGVATAGIIGGVTAGIMGKAGKVISRSAAGRKMGGLARSAGRKISKLFKSGCGCFTEGTLVKTENGFKTIQNIKIGDKVWSYNETTKEKELRKVTNTFVLQRESTYTLSFGGKNVEASSDHPFYTGTRWVETASLHIGDSIQLFTGQKTVIDSIDFTAGYTDVYNFEVEDFHNYYVGKEGMLVHNVKASCLAERGVNRPSWIGGHKGTRSVLAVIQKAGNKIKSAVSNFKGGLTQTYSYISKNGNLKTRNIWDIDHKIPYRFLLKAAEKTKKVITWSQMRIISNHRSNLEINDRN